MPIEEIISANLLPFFGLLFLLVFVGKNIMFNKAQSRFFIIAIVVNMVLIVAVCCDYLFSQMAIPNIYILRRITSFLNHGLSPLIPFMLVHIFQKQKLHWLCYVPIILNCIICFISMFTNIVFFITPENVAVRGVLFFIPLVAAGFYLLVLMIQHGRTHSRTRRVEKLFLFSIVIMLSACLAMEFRYGYKFLTWNCAALSLLLYYLLLCIQNWLTDPLTGCYNRTSYLREIERMNHNVSGVLALIDINDFKSINDHFGHAEGDKRLMKFADIMQKHFINIAKVYRIGGDEFVLLSDKANSKAMMAAVELVRASAIQRNITFACGLIEYSPADDIEEVLKRADNIMYENKTRMKCEVNTK